MTAGDIVIIGAPRSGTNMLRDILTSRQGLVTWPCDEVNALWRHGSRDHPTDELPVERAGQPMQRFMAAQFERVRRRYDGHTVVEKTCANSLRVAYVAACLPRARFILITRDGVDAAASAMARWNAPVDWGYTARKARFVPPSDLPQLALRFARARASRRRGQHHAAPTWGPRFEGIDELVSSSELEQVCAMQWKRCVELSQAALVDVSPEQVYRMSYEEFVQSPEVGLVDLLDFLHLPTDGVRAAVTGVSAESIGKGRASFGEDALTRVEHIVSPTLEGLDHV